MKRVLGFILISILSILICSGCNGSGGSDTQNNKEETPRDVSSLRVATLNDADADLIAAVTIKESDETLFLSGDKDQDGNPLAIDTIGFIPIAVQATFKEVNLGYAGWSPMCKLKLNEDRMPYRLITEEGHYLEYTEYKNSSVKIALFTSYGEQVGESKTISISSKDLENLNSLSSTAFSNITSQGKDEQTYKMVLADLNSAIEFSGLAFNWAGSLAKKVASYDLWKGELAGDGSDELNHVHVSSDDVGVISKQKLDAETIVEKVVYWIEKISESELLPTAAKLTDNKKMDLVSVAFDEMSCTTSSLKTKYCISDFATLAEKALSEKPCVTISSPKGTENFASPYSADSVVKLYGTASKIGEIESFSWDFGDGSFGTGKSVEHKYTAGGSYEVRLRVLYTDGAEVSDTANIHVDNTLNTIKESILNNPNLTPAQKEKLLKALEGGAL